MALITIAGTVFAVANEKTLNVWEIKRVDNRDIFVKWSIWADQPWGVIKGDWVEVKGELGTKVGEYQGKPVVDHSLWQPTLIQHKPNLERMVESGNWTDSQGNPLTLDDNLAPF